MTNVLQISRAARGKEREKACVVALHCSLGSGRQWKALADELGRSHRFFAPDISGYGANSCALDLPLTLAEEIRALSGTLNDADGTDPSRRPFLRRRDCVQDRDLLRRSRIACAA